MKKKNLSTYIGTTNIMLTNNLLIIQLKKTKNIINMSHMFENCKFLKSISDFSEWGTKNVTDMIIYFMDLKKINKNQIFQVGKLKMPLI